MTSKRTPSADWREAGEEDPHPWYAGKRREDLALGDLTDDQMANAVFLYADQRPDISAVIAGTAKMPIVYTTAAKDRIRWLSRQNEANAARVEQLRAKLKECEGWLAIDGEYAGSPLARSVRDLLEDGATT
jgi:hypothetical protein